MGITVERVGRPTLTVRKEGLAMVASELERQLAETTATIPSLREALAETNRGMVALTWLLDK